MYDVLHEFLSMINARIYFSEGIFHIDQIGWKGANSSVTYEKYQRDKDYDSDGASTGDLIFTDFESLQADANPSISSIAPVQYVEILQKGDNLSNILLGKSWSKDEASSELTTSITELNSYDRIFFTFKWWHYMRTTRDRIMPGTSAIPVAWMSVDITISINDGTDTHYYKGLYRDIYYDRPTASDKTIKINAVYSGTTANHIRLIIPISNLPSDDPNEEDPLYLIKIPVQISTDVLAHTGDVTVNISNFALWQDSAISVPLVLDPQYAVSGETEEIYHWEAVEALFLIGRSLEDASTTNERSTSLVNDSRNNLVITEEFSMGVFPNTTSYQKLEVWDGSEWVDSTGWKGTGDTTYHRIAVQVIRDILKQRTKPSDLIEISLWDSYTLVYNSYSRRFDYKGRKCIWLDWSHNTQTDTITGSLWEMNNATVADAPTPIEVTNPKNIIGLPPGFVPNNDPPVYNLLGEYDSVNNQLRDDFYDEGTMSGDSIDLTGYNKFPDPSEYTMKSINHSIKVHIGSTKYHIVDKAKTALQNTECRLNFLTKAIEFNRSLSGRLWMVDARNLFVASSPTA